MPTQLIAHWGMQEIELCQYTLLAVERLYTSLALDLFIWRGLGLRLVLMTSYCRFQA